MKILMKSWLVILLALSLTGCFGEDYDVGVPTAHLYTDNSSIQLTEANIDWSTASENVQQSIENIEEFTLSQQTIHVSSGEKIFLDFKENEENGGDIWTDAKITIWLLTENERIELELDESSEFHFQNITGNYVLEVDFVNSAGKAQYVGNLMIH